MTLAASPNLIKGGIVLLDASSGAILQVIALQYNPDTVSRTLAAQSVAVEGQNRSEPLRLKGPAVETWKVEIELDATDQLELPDQNPAAVSAGLLPQLAVLETIIYPSSQTLIANHQLAQSGTLEIAPMEAPLTLFVWGAGRIMPVRLTDFSVTEDAFDVSLNPMRAKVSLGMRVLNVDDFPWDHLGTSLYLAYQQQKEALAQMNKVAALAALGVGNLP